jgi:hypothetical protein
MWESEFAQMARAVAPDKPGSQAQRNAQKKQEQQNNRRARREAIEARRAAVRGMLRRC